MLFCDKILGQIYFLGNAVLLCCNCTRVPYSPPLLQKTIPEKFSVLKYYNRIAEIIKSNQGNKKACGGCSYLKEMIVPKVDFDGNINFFTLNHFTKCNSRCIYCSIYKSGTEFSHRLLPTLKKLLSQNLIKKDCFFNWGGGEPTLCPEFDKLTDFIISNKFSQIVNSSGIKFSESILNGMREGTLSVQISPDAGTADTYLKVKRQKNFDKVWENIEKYAEYPERLYVKYIIFGLNSDESEIRAFIDKCVSAKVKNVVIDCEFNSVRGNLKHPFKITEKEINAAILMKKLCEENNFEIEISENWTPELQERIKNS